MYGYFEGSSKCFLYKYLPDTFSLQYYLRKSIPENLVSYITKCRLSAHRLAVEQGRFNETARAERTCRLCTLNQIEDEYHFILVCPLYSRARRLYIKMYYWSSPSMFKLVQLFSTHNRKELCNLGTFLRDANRVRDNVIN